MAILTYDQAIKRATIDGAIEIYDWFKASPPAISLSGQYMSTWFAEGRPGPGVAPSNGSASLGAGGTARASASGSIEFDDQSPLIKYLFACEGTVHHTSTVQGSIIIMDRLVDAATISLATTGNKDINTTALTRYTDGKGVEMWLEISTATTVTPVVCSANYTDTANASVSGVSLTLPAAANPQRSLFRLPYVAGGSGAKSWQTLNVATAASAGVATAMLVRPIVELPVMSTGWNFRDTAKQLDSLPIIYDGASLMVAFTLTAGSTLNEISGSLTMIYG